jgi:hypothetical protein
MESRVRVLAEELARRSTTRRQFIDRAARLGFAAIAALTANAAFGSIVAMAWSCSPPCGQYCNSFVVGCDRYQGCYNVCWINTTYYPTGCWGDGGTGACCDCWCSGHYGNPTCWGTGKFACGCHTSGTAPAQEAGAANHGAAVGNPAH